MVGGWLRLRQATFRMNISPPSGGNGTDHAQRSLLQPRRWLLLGVALLALAGRPATGGETPLQTTTDRDGAEPAPAGFEAGARMNYSESAPSSASLLHRIQPDTGARGSYSLTRNFGLSSADAADPGARLRQSTSRSPPPRLTSGQSSLLATAATMFDQHFKKLTPWSGQSGSGILYPINETLGVFVDARTVMPNGSKYYGVARAGIRVMF